MSDPIIFEPLGTVLVTLDDGTEVRLGRPKFGQWKWFTRRLQVITDEVQASLTEGQAKVDAAKTDAARKKAQDEFDVTSGKPMYEYTIPFIEELFKQLGDKPLPEVDEWPAWLAADWLLGSRILSHWRTIPKASGPMNPN